MLTTLHGTPLGFYFFPNKKKMDEVAQHILSVEPYILNLPLTWKNDGNSPTSARYLNYNYLAFPGKTPKMLHDFFRECINDFYDELGWKKVPRYLQCWVNVHRKNHFLRWHNHPTNKISGHITVACRGTETQYLSKETFSVRNQPGMLTLIGDSEVLHRTTVQKSSSRPRISIAFDLYENPIKVRPSWVKL